MTTERHEEHARLADLVARHRDRAAFETLFDHFAPRINGYLQQLGLGPAAAEDIAQEVMTVLWNKAHLFDPAKSSLATWLFRVARNRRIDAARRDRSHLLDETDPMLWPQENADPDEEFDAGRREASVRAALAQLPHGQLELLRLAYYLGLSQSQIAERTGLPLGTVKSRVRLAFGRLRTLLEADTRVDRDD
jgi:RNA polymerase sigma factor (sigma-70 family)